MNAIKRFVMNHIDWVLFVVLTGFGLYVVACRPWGFDLGAAAGLAGALFGGAALLLGNWINRANERFKAEQEQAGQVEKLKTLIAAELVDVACGLMDAKRLVDAAIHSRRADGSVADTLDMSPYRPRQMPFTDSLGTKLLAVEKEAIDAIATLRSNLAVTRQSMDEITAGTSFGLLKATLMSNGLGHDMTILAEAFSHIAPNRKLRLQNAEPELVTEILKRAANPI
ncbi:hypothetical protein F6R98_19370 [Candidatus Methylospira mobilis]|uniref:Uncharacterized protein n=1 Tax=Candidatus Methylospira mobilis TaxID=1808979 RepID=A0A5Q0BL58_9GAMM|nr:hypothetical protein [Candidatus Methylospira mobilis]QFY44520.1 hypothetical protein F6R98_19370 [Candidatus Methylospira mobilis]